MFAIIMVRTKNYGNDGSISDARTTRHTHTQNNLPVTGRQSVETKTREPPVSNPPDTSSPLAGNQQPTNPPTDTPPQVTTPPAASNPAKDALMGLEIPADMKPTPIGSIDVFIRRGYLSRDALEALMKHNFKGKAYRKEVEQRLALFEARQPPFNDIPVGAVPTAGGLLAAGTSQITGGRLPAESPETPTIPGSPQVASSVQSAGNPPQDTEAPSEFVAARSLTDAEVISSFRSESGTGRV